MDNQYNTMNAQQNYSNGYILSPNNGQAQKQKNRGKRVFVIIGCALAGLAIIVAAIVILVNRNSPEVDGNFTLSEFEYSKNDRYSDLLNLFANLSNDMTEDVLMEVMAKSGIDSSYLHLNAVNPDGDSEEIVDDEVGYNTSDGQKSYIASIALDPDADHKGQNLEFISFNFIPADENEPVGRIENVTYHSYRNGKYDYIDQTSDNEFTHHYDDGNYANSFESLGSAIEDYVGRF